LARKPSAPPAATERPAERQSETGLDVASVAPWILFWGWVALDSALAYRKSQAVLEQAALVEREPPSEPAPEEAPHIRHWWFTSPMNLDGLREVKRRARTAMIGAPIIALLGPVLLKKLLRRNKS